MLDIIFNTVMDIKGTTKDTLNTWKDLKIICNGQKLELDKRRMNVMPKAVYTLTVDGPTLRFKKLREYLQVPTDNHNYNLHNPNGTQLVIELYVANHQGAGTSRSGNYKSYDESDDDSFDKDYETEEDKNSN
ncbi:UNVERIFIED_CONTAM: hypothetical protein Sindi_1852100 [Sesamum indicum]